CSCRASGPRRPPSAGGSRRAAASARAARSCPAPRTASSAG
ncbi:MAG: hypothetical protein AVDCRST_MAG40-2716, partial [uncultured Gemmatimonadaceae bacterium]